MIWRWAAGACAVLLLAVCAGCGDDPAPATPKPSAAETAGLANAKAAAGIDDCPASTKQQPGTNNGLPNNGLPAVTLECLGGGPGVQLAAVADRPTVLNLWASWCGPCRKEMPLFEKLHQSAPDLQVLGVDFGDDSAAAAIEFARSAGVTFAQMADPARTLAKPLKVIGLPQTVFVDADGRIVANERRAFTSYKDLRDTVDEHLGQSP